jgi:AhpD family alkylhydroperoxidase
MKDGFSKKIFTFNSFANSLYYVIGNFGTIIKTVRSKEIARDFVEKIMLVTSAVNGCVYCEWFHAKMAANSGMDTQEIKEMLDLQFKTDASEFELPALLYAQHYAETNKTPDPQMEQQLIEFYGEDNATYIKTYIELIFFGNLSGNTFDAFLSRLRGKRAPDSAIVFELFFFIISAPFLLPVLPFIKNKP